MNQQSSKRHTNSHPRGVLPLTEVSFPTQRINLVRGFSVDENKTHRIDQIFTVKDGHLFFGVPVSSEPLNTEISTSIGKSLEPGMIIPGLVCRVPFDEHGFGKPEFYNTMLENVQRMTPAELGDDLFNQKHPELLILEKALKQFHADRTCEVLPWVYSDPYEAIMGEPRQSKARDSALSRGNGYISDLSVLMHHLAGDYLRSKNVEALFLARTVKILSPAERIKVEKYSDFLQYLTTLEAPSEVLLSISPMFWTTKPIINMGEGGGEKGGYVVPCTCPLRSLTARVNVRIISLVAAGIIPEDPSGDIKAIAALRNSEMRKRHGSEVSSRIVRMELTEGENGVQAIRQVPNRPSYVDTLGEEKELSRYHEQCGQVAKILLKSRPHAAHIAFVIGAFDRSRKNDWEKVRHAALLWLQALPELILPVCELLRVPIQTEQEKLNALPRLIEKLDTAQSYFDGLPFKARGFHFNDLPDVYARTEKEYLKYLRTLLLKLGLKGLKCQVHKERIYEDERSREHRTPHVARFQIKVGSNTYESEWCTARQIKTAQHKAAASLLRVLIRENVIPWKIVKDNTILNKGSRVIPNHPGIQMKESNSENWQMIRNLHPLITTFDLIMFRKGWRYEVILSGDMNQSETSHVILKIYRDSHEDVLIESVRDNVLNKKRDAMRRALRYYMSELLIKPEDLRLHKMRVIGRIEKDTQNNAPELLFVDKIANPLLIANGTKNYQNGEMVEAQISYSKRKRRYFARILDS